MIYFISDTQSNFENDYELSTIEKAVEYCTSKPVLAVDTETEGLDFTSDKMIMFQIGDKDNQFVIDTRFISIEPFREVLESDKHLKILHNAKFDYKFIKRWANITMENVYDTFLTEKVLTCGKDLRYGLGHLCLRYLKVELKKEVRLQFTTLGGSPFSVSQITYGAKDVEHLCAIRELQLPLIESLKLHNVVELENSATLGFADIEYNGLDIDREAWLEIAKHSAQEAHEISVNLDKMIIIDRQFDEFVANYLQGDLFIPKEQLRDVLIKWTSPKQVLAVFKKLVPKLENVNGKDMYKYRREFPLIDRYIQYKEKKKLSTSYGESFFKFVASDGKIHTNFNQILDTGRVSSSKPNMQQIPADNRFRNCFVAPKDWCFVSSDYSSQELNVIAFGSKDPVWLDALTKGQDLHSVCAELVYGDGWKDAAEDDCAYYGYSTGANVMSYKKDSNGVDVRCYPKQKCKCPAHKKLRTNVKTVNFGLAYGMGPSKLADTLSIDLKDAETLIKEYFKAFPSIGAFLDKLGTYGKKFGYIKTFPPYNRKRWFPEWYPSITKNKSSIKELSSIERASKNTPIQGCSADMTKLALIKIRAFIKNNNAPVKMVMTVHDQIDTICSIDYADKWVVKMTQLMESAALEVVTNGLLKSDTNISKSWEK